MYKVTLIVYIHSNRSGYVNWKEAKCLFTYSRLNLKKFKVDKCKHQPRGGNRGILYKVTAITKNMNYAKLLEEYSYINPFGTYLDGSKLKVVKLNSSPKLFL